MLNDLRKEYVSVTYNCGHKGLVMVETMTEGYIEKIEMIEESESCIGCTSKQRRNMMISKEIMALETKIRLEYPNEYMVINDLIRNGHKYEALVLISRSFERSIGDADMLIRYLLNEEEIDVDIPLKVEDKPVDENQPTKVVEEPTKEVQRDWTKVTDMNLINFLKNQVKIIKKENRRVSGNFTMDKKTYWLSTYRGKNGWITAIYRNKIKLNTYLVSFENGRFLNVGKIVEKEV